jgi:Fungal Zn(2)-Cys(6) binuclear cluster domain
MTTEVSPPSGDESLWWGEVGSQAERSGSAGLIHRAASVQASVEGAPASSMSNGFMGALTTTAPTTTTVSASNSSGTRGAVAVACVACRSRHLKCDGGTRCSRCAVEGIQCSYVKSRRGWKGPRKSVRRDLGPPSHDVSSGRHSIPYLFLVPKKELGT